MRLALSSVCTLPQWPHRSLKQRPTPMNERTGSLGSGSGARVKLVRAVGDEDEPVRRYRRKDSTTVQEDMLIRAVAKHGVLCRRRRETDVKNQVGVIKAQPVTCSSIRQWCLSLGVRCCCGNVPHPICYRSILEEQKQTCKNTSMKIDFCMLGTKRIPRNFSKF